MITLVGSKTCSRCEVVRKALINKGKEVEYLLLEDMSRGDKLHYTKLINATREKNLPLIVVDNKTVKLQEVI